MNTNARRKQAKPRLPNISRDGESSAFRSILRSALYALCVTLTVAIVLLVVLSIIAYNNPDPDALVAPFAYGTLFLSALIGGIAAAKINRSAGLLSGATTGLLLLVVLFIASLFTGNSETNNSFGVTLAFYVGVILVCAIGGIIGSYKPKRRRRRITPK
ncbi:MAG: TIGR04086 family membrane protein [Clostridiales bacterium]|nr:TIGR04086 family membrane protein [Clostridiales bacterium]